MMKPCSLLLAGIFAWFVFEQAAAQANLQEMDSIKASIDTLNKANVADNIYSFKPTQLIIPATLIGVGVIGLESDWLKFQNKEMRDELQEDIDKRISIDDFSQYAPMASVYALNLCGIKGEHNLRDRTVILATSALLMGITTNALKYTTKVQRPDGSSRNSFPSGHTAMAFMGAEFLYQEYKDVSPWIGAAGYTVAAGTGFFRMYNNRHWFTDVLAGAGIGILSTKAAYWLFPAIDRHIFGRSSQEKYKNIVLAAPFVSNEGKGISCVVHF